MSEYLFGVVKDDGPSAALAKRWDRICREEGGSGYTWTRRPDVNDGRYQGWFSGPNLGHPFDRDLERRVLARTIEPWQRARKQEEGEP